jgi:integrase
MGEREDGRQWLRGAPGAEGKTPAPQGRPVLGRPATLAGLSPEAEAYARAAFARNTRRAYNADIAHFADWCARQGHTWLPVALEALGNYLAAHAATLKVSTLRRRLAAIGRAHALAGHDFARAREVARTVMAGIAANHGSAPRQAAALTTTEVRRLVHACDDTLQGTRDRALLLLAYAGALRRSELVALRGEHLRTTAEGVEITVARSKGDQEGAGQRVGIPRDQRRETCPVRALERWLEVAPTGPHEPLFRKVTVTRARKAGRRGQGAVVREVVETRPLHPDSVRFILRRRAEAAGIVGTTEEPVSPHGLRAGFVTQAYKAGVGDEAIMAHTRHRDLRTMRGYVRRARLVEDSPARKLGL